MAAIIDRLIDGAILGFEILLLATVAGLAIEICLDVVLILMDRKKKNGK